jgi:peptidoglycan/LPS O-acetylase OafA/YrhL
MGPFGWLLILSSGIGLILATWLLYGNEYDGMWAGYRDGIIGTVVVLAAMALNSTLPKPPALAVVGLSGILLILFAVFLDNSTHVFVSELLAGIGMLLGVGLYASGRRD